MRMYFIAGIFFNTLIHSYITKHLQDPRGKVVRVAARLQILLYCKTVIIIIMIFVTGLDKNQLPHTYSKTHLFSITQ